MNSPVIAKTYGFIWLGIAIAAFCYLIYSNLQFNACCRGQTSDMAIGFMSLFIGIAATVILVFALISLLAKSRAAKRLALIMLGVAPSILLIGQPLIALILIIAMIFALRSLPNDVKPETAQNGRLQ